MGIDKHDIEQAAAGIRLVGRLWFNMYQGCLDAGFDVSAAMELVKAYAHGMGMKSEVAGPGSDDPSGE